MLANYPRALANCMREARETLGLTQKQASELSGLRQATISKIENNPANCSINSVLLLAKAYRLELHLLPMLNMEEYYNHDVVKSEW
ncbi:helix-turn-helix transcriptional regulator [Photobacterium damselae subsp. piscicida]|uniref:helix-turn-helix domain-containing protein n=1 Tax=Photobacterium damselae TaxID=38293 RepID=UPI00030F56A7|nr:helix-turn-helix transcriptional regulator [Photobacterium damselae]OLQ79711.1 transcriptional regulator [Photobacterium damselae subsp. piscicida]TFZ47849.1 XRE family transcriptional regulator [Photobacterium damselae subsp. piscicida]TJZ90383.1 helix-turn-helix transcriptional regulator [Photobacterium damselae subsp. piscicida]